MNLPLKRRVASGSGTVSPLFRISFSTSHTTDRIPRKAASGDEANQLRLGNSAHKPTY